MRRTIGSLLLAAGLALAGCKGHEVKTSMAEVPAPVRATLEKESKGGKVTEVEKETKSGKTVYSADVTTADGKKWDITVGEDGKVLSKEPD
jgi:uncharacterized membrane protein YkoI